MWLKFELEKVSLINIQIFGHFVNTLTAGHNFSLVNRGKLRQPIQMQLSENKKLFGNTFLHFWNVDKILQTSRQKITFIADIFQKLQIPKHVVREMSKKSRFRGPFDKQHGKWDQTVLKSEWHHSYHIYWSMWWQLSSKISLLVRGKILGPFFGKLTTCHKYSRPNRDSLTQPINMQLPLKGKTFSQFFYAFLKCRSNFRKKMILRAHIFSKLRTWKPVVR